MSLGGVTLGLGGSALKMRIEDVNTIGCDRRSAFSHFGAGGFEDFALAVGEALDAVGGNFVEDGIDFFRDEFFGREFGFVQGLVGPLVGLTGVDKDFGFAEDIHFGDTPFPFHVADPADVGVAKKKAAEMRPVSPHAGAGRRNKDEKGAKSDQDVEQDTGRKTEHKHEVNILGGMDQCKGGEKARDASRSSDNRRWEIAGQKEGAKGVEQTASETSAKVEGEPLACGKYPFQRRAAKIKCDAVEKDMDETAMQKLESQQLPNVTARN